ncbi:MAG: nucleotidyltransferase domain-containing protein [Bacteroidota bacterium]
MRDKIRILKELKTLLVRHFGDDIDDVILFGSQATGKAHEYSDYDLMIILKNDYDWKYKKHVRYVCYDIALKYDIFLNTKIISLNELYNSLRGKQPLFTDALKEGIYV